MEQQLLSPKQRAEKLASVAASLNAARIERSRDPAPFALALMTDPRVPVTAATVQHLPHPANARSAVIFRHYDAPDRAQLARTLCHAAHNAGHLFIVAGDPGLAASSGADGVHLPEWQLDQARQIRATNPDWIVSAACHSREAIERAARGGVDCAILSPVFATASHPAANPLGTERLTEMLQEIRLPVLVLGGINENNAQQLLNTGAAGIAAVSALSLD